MSEASDYCDEACVLISKFELNAPTYLSDMELKVMGSYLDIARNSIRFAQKVISDASERQSQSANCSECGAVCVEIGRDKNGKVICQEMENGE